jgi:hypothetical protein
MLNMIFQQYKNYRAVYLQIDKSLIILIELDRIMKQNLKIGPLVLLAHH